MAEKIKNFLKTTLLGGMMVMLPVMLTFIVIRWLFRLITGFINPIFTT